MVEESRQSYNILAKKGYSATVLCPVPYRSTPPHFCYSWALDVGCWMLGVGCWTLDVGCWVLDDGRGMMDVGCWILECWNVGC